MICSTARPASLRGADGGAALTGIRTAAVSGACIAALAPADAGHVAITGAGVEARSAPARCSTRSGAATSVVWDHRAANRDAAAGLGGRARAGDRAARPPASAAEAADGAAIVSRASRSARGRPLDPQALRDDALLLPLDYATSVGADIANAAACSADDVPQFDGYRGAHFPG